MRRFFLKLFRRGGMHQDIQAELAFHREMAARHDNAIPLGNAAVIGEHGYDLWRFTFLKTSGATWFMPRAGCAAVQCWC